MLDGAKAQETWLKTLKNLSSEFWKQDRKIYKFNSSETSGWTIGGYYRQTGNFTFISVSKSGHFMPADNYHASQAFLEDYIKYGILKCQDTETHCRVHQKMCKYMNEC